MLDWAALVLNRVDRRSFFDKFQESHAVQYFYEPFLEAFDPELRKELGVWYTPPEIVKYMVERVDTVLREELNLPDGLADKNVYVLDPCCGTGSYLVEVLDRIHRTLKERGEDALTASDLKEAAQKRVFGFEIMPAPFVVSHLQLGLLLQNLGAPLSEKSKERVGVYLTNALTGWEPPKGPKAEMLFSELEEERDLAEEVKRLPDPIDPTVVRRGARISSSAPYESRNANGTNTARVQLTTLAALDDLECRDPCVTRQVVRAVGCHEHPRHRRRGLGV